MIEEQLEQLLKKALKEIDKEEKILKETYNKTLKRYYNGCNYIEEHIEEVDNYLPVVKELLNRINKILEKIPNVTEEEILNGFKT